MAKTLRIEELEKEVESIKKKKYDERELRKVTESSHLKVKDELASVHEAKIKKPPRLRKKRRTLRLGIAIVSMALAAIPNF